MTEPRHADFPISQVAPAAERLIAEGNIVFFKWTCGACGERVMFSEPNKLYTRAEHSGCPVEDGFITHLDETGCNYMVVAVLNPEIDPNSITDLLKGGE